MLTCLNGSKVTVRADRSNVLIIGVPEPHFEELPHSHKFSLSAEAAIKLGQALVQLGTQALEHAEAGHAR